MLITSMSLLLTVFVGFSDFVTVTVGLGTCYLSELPPKKDNEEFSVGNLRYKCASGLANITGCQLDNGKQLYPGDRVDSGRSTYECMTANGGIQFIVRDAPPPSGFLGGYFMVQGLFTRPDSPKSTRAKPQELETASEVN
ncbi:hypothetical protein AAVH_32763 [Aphelenchoides avenae]|nr:hypothetical protein AAVH_32763 [Aphelenchus avenae]